MLLLTSFVLTVLTIQASALSLRESASTENDSDDVGEVVFPDSIEDEGKLLTHDQTGSLKCGEARPAFTNGNLLDTQAQFGELPWTVLLFIERLGVNKNLYPACAGTLIHPRAIITASYCVSDKVKVASVRAGEWDISDEVQEPLQHQERQVEKIIIHPNHTDFTVKPLNPKNTIAIVLLKEPFDLADNVNVACLPEVSLDEVDSTSCVASGWGNDPKGNRSKIQKKIGMGIVGKKQCEESLGPKIGKDFQLDDSSICAGGKEGIDVCVGDGGGPLVCPKKENGAMALIGVTSWGLKCGTAHPGVYSDVAANINWIKNELAKIK